MDFPRLPSYKKIYLFAGYFNCRLTALAPTDKAPLPPSHRDGRATPAWRRRILLGIVRFARIVQLIEEDRQAA
jgi:hypothetical protein